MDKKVEQLLAKLGRTEEEFNELIFLAKEAKIIYPYRELCKSYCNEYIHNQSTQYTIIATKEKKVMQDTSIMKLPEDVVLKELMGEEEMEAYKKRIEQVQSHTPKMAVKITTVEQEVPINIYMNYDTGLYTGKAEIYKDFLYDKKLYSFGKMASFLGLELNIIERGTGSHKDVYLIFIKNYSEIEYYNINDVWTEPESDDDKNIANAKKVLTIAQVQSDMVIAVNKVIEFSNIIENTIKQLFPANASIEYVK